MGNHQDYIYLWLPAEIFNCRQSRVPCWFCVCLTSGNWETRLCIACCPVAVAELRQPEQQLVHMFCSLSPGRAGWLCVRVCGSWKDQIWTYALHVAICCHKCRTCVIHFSLPKGRRRKAESVLDQGDSPKNQTGSISNVSLKMLMGISWLHKAQGSRYLFPHALLGGLSSYPCSDTGLWRLFSTQQNAGLL